MVEYYRITIRLPGNACFQRITVLPTGQQAANATFSVHYDGTPVPLLREGYIPSLTQNAPLVRNLRHATRDCATRALEKTIGLAPLERTSY